MRQVHVSHCLCYLTLFGYANGNAIVAIPFISLSCPEFMAQNLKYANTGTNSQVSLLELSSVDHTCFYIVMLL